MLYVKVHKEIKEYDEKLFLKLSGRQLLFGLLAISIGVSLYLLCVFVLRMPSSIVSYLVMFISFPIFAIGFLKINGMSFDKYFQKVIQFYYHKQKLVYDNGYDPKITDKADTNGNVKKKKRRKKISEKDDI